MNKKTLVTVAITAAVVYMFSAQIDKLPLVNKLPKI
jgi:hypothetical protein